MASEYAHQFILLKQLLDWFLSKIVRAFSLRIVHEITVLCVLVFHRVSPHEVAKHSVEGNFLESIDRIDFVNQVQFW